MAELSIIAAVAQIADVGLRLSIKLYTFGEIVATADRAVISISKDVSLTSGVLKELGQILEKDRKSRTFSENAIQTADGVVKECLEVFQEMDSILVKKLPSLGAGRRNEETRAERPKRAMVLLEKLKWGYLQPKLQLLRSNLDRLKSTLLLMLNVITYARQVSEKTESPAVIAEQRSLIEDLAHSNQDYIREFEKLRLGIGGDAVENTETISKAGTVETELTGTEPVPPAPKRKFDSMNFAAQRTPLQDEHDIRRLRFNEPTIAASLSPNARSGVAKLPATPPNADIDNVLVNTSGRFCIAMPPMEMTGKPTTEAPLGFDQEVLFKQLRYFSMLVQDLLKEVDEPRYKITFQSRLRMKGGIAGLHEGERRELEKIWGCTALQRAEQRLDSLVDESGDLLTMRKSTLRSFFSPNDLPPSRPRKQRRDSLAGSIDNRPYPQGIAMSGTRSPDEGDMIVTYALPSSDAVESDDPLGNFDFSEFDQPPDDQLETFHFSEIGQIPEASERENTKDVSQPADTELVDHFVSLWTTLKL